MSTQLAVLLASICLASLPVAAQDAGGKSAGAAGWTTAHQEELQERLFPVAAPRGPLALLAVRCVVEGEDGQGPLLHELTEFGRERVVLKTRRLAAPSWAAAVAAAAADESSLDVGSVAARIEVVETKRDSKDCPELLAVVARADALRFPAAAPYFTVPPGPSVSCHFQSMGRTTVTVSVAVLDADESWKPFLDWVKRLSHACLKK